ARVESLPDPDVHADRPGGCGLARTHRRSRSERSARSGHRGWRPRRIADIGARSSRHGRGLPDPELLRIDRASRRVARDRCQSAAPLAEGHAHAMNAPRHAIAASHVFDGAVLHRDSAVVIEGTTIAALVPRGDVPARMALHRLPEEAWLTPGFIDTQVNGGGDVLFNNQPTPEGIAAIVAAHRKFGTTAMLPTLISDAPQKAVQAIAA